VKVNSIHQADRFSKYAADLNKVPKWNQDREKEFK